MSDTSQTNPPENPENKPSKMRHTEDERRITHENTADDSRLEHKEIDNENVLRHDEENTDEAILQHKDEDSVNNGDSQHDDSIPRDNTLPAVRVQEENMTTPPDTPENENSNGENINNPADSQTDAQINNQSDADPQNESNGFGIDEGKLAAVLTTVGRIFPDDDNITSQAIKHDIVETPSTILSAISDVKNMRERGRRLFFENKDKNEKATSSVNEPSSVETDGETDDEPPGEEILALPEPVLSLPPGKKSIDSENSKGDTALAENENSLFDGENNGRIPIVEATEKRCYYEVLGVSQDADEGEIKNAYRTLAKKCHPDVNRGDTDAEAKFKEINEAYSVLGDPEKRQAYDKKIRVKTADKTGVNRPAQKGAAENKPNIESKGSPDGKNAKTPADGKNGGKKKDRILRRVLDGSYIFSQAAAHLMPDETQDENSGTKGVRKMISESAKLIKVFATAEKPKDSKMNHEDDEETLTHEDDPEESRLEHEKIDGESPLQLEDSETPSDNMLEGGESLQENLQITDGNDSAINDGSTEKTENGQNEAESGGIIPISQDTGQDSGDIDITEDTADSETNSDTIIPDFSNDSDDTVDADDFDVITPKSKSDIKIENKIDKNIDKLTAETAKLEKKIGKAEKKIPKKKVKKSKLVHDKKTGEVKREISFADEKIDKADAKWNQGQSNTLSANAGRYVAGHASAVIHGKISAVENMTGNTGLQAAHTTQKGAVKTYTTAKKVHRYVKNAPYRNLQHLKVKQIENKGKLAYQQLLKNKPELRKQPISRIIQKKRIKKQYAKALRAAKKGGSAAGALGAVGTAVGVGSAVVSGDGKGLAKMGAMTAGKIAFKKAGLALVKAAAPILLKIGLILLILAAVLLLFTMCASLFSSSTSYVLEAISYTADMDDITEYSVYMTQLEVELKEEIMEASSNVDGLHEFRLVINSPSGGTDMIFEGTLISEGLGHPHNTPPVYEPPDFDPLVFLPFLTDITHNPFEIMAYLTTAYGDFTGHDINAILREIFETAFTLNITESFEVRSAIVECWYYELQDLGGYVDGVWVSNWQNVRVEPFEEIMFYDWYFREVSLTVNMTVSQVIQDKLTDEQQEQYDILMESHGLRQFVGSPFADNWYGAVSSNYGYRFHPINQTKEMHTGIDIAQPEGTPILSGAPGIVTFAGDNGSYGNTVIIEYFDEETGIGVQILYAHLADIDVDVGDELEIGGAIGTVGSTGTSTGAHLHMEVSINENGGAWRRINPLFFVEPYPS